MAAGLGFKTFNTGDVLSAADVNGYLMQGVLVFASAAARDAAITAPAEGQFAFTKDTNGLWYYDGAAWVASGATGDIEGVTAGTGISGGGTSGTVTITNSMATAIDAKGDLIVGTGADTFSKLTAGTNGYLLTADSAEATGLKWAAPAGGGGGLVFIGTTTFTGTTTINVNDVFSTTYTNYRIIITGVSTTVNAAQCTFRLRVSSTDTITNYRSLRIYADGGTVGTDNNVVGTDEILTGSLGKSGAGTSLQIFDIGAPYTTTPTGIMGSNFRTGANTNEYQMNITAGNQTDSTSFTGFTILSTETATGTIAVYGYAKA